MKVMMMISTFWIIFFPTITLFSCLPTVTSQLPYDTYPTANLSTLWINNDSGYPADLVCTDNSKFRIILLGGTTSGLAYASGFHSNGTSDSYLFATFIVDTYDGNVYCDDIVWSANRNNPVGINSTLELTAEGDLVLKDGDGTVAWSTNTAGRSVARLNLTEMGNLVLLDANDSAVWQSFDRSCGMALIQSYHQQGRLNFTVTSQAQVCSFKDNSKVGIILHGGTTNGAAYACGFYSNSTRDSYLFATFIILISNGYIQYDIAPRVVWSANRNNPVGINSTLELTAEGDLVLKDGDGTLAWSTYTAGRSVARLDFTDMGNLVLLDSNDSPVWQSFDHPTYCWLPGQSLKPGMNLTAGLFSVSVEAGQLVASIKSDHRQVHYFAVTELNNQKSYDLIYTNIHEAIYYNTSSTLHQYIKLGTDGHLRVFELNSSTPESSSWHEVADIFTDYGLSECAYPSVCGPYGICTDGQCSCPNDTSFWPINDRYLNLGCSEVVPLTCNASDNHYLLDLDNVTYFDFKADIFGIDMNGCKEACLKNCSCKAVIFTGRVCYMPSQIFSLWEKDSVNPQRHSGSVSIKIQNAPTIRSHGVRANGRNNSDQLGLILGSSLGVLFVAVVIGVFVYRRKRRRFEEVEEDYLDHVPGMPTRFSFQELAIATDNFNKKLGEGGFGSVFEGSFSDGTRIAVKRLEGVGHIKKSFLAEVQSIGSIHHINLVRLIGFCAEKSHRLLVYAYMCNGSLERWIYCKSHDKMLEWHCRRNIILDIAKGLAYLHEDCLQKIIHLDIKPQNILLDDGFNAKLGDFGLSKLIDRNQSNVVTTMRGTPGYLAPEWLKSAITEKVDVYSFGVVILEIVCGRKIFEQSRPEEERHLPTLFMNKAEEGQWLDLVDKCCLDVEANVAEVEEMMQIAAWCLQSVPEKRPCVSMVIKILEENVNVPKDMNYNFLISQSPEGSSSDASRLLPSLLSGPR